MEGVLGAVGDIAVRFVDDIYAPGKSLIGILAFILGIWLNGYALIKWWKGSQEGFRGNNSGGGILAKTVCGTFLIYLGEAMGAFTGTLFGGETVVSQSLSLDFSVGGGMTQQANAVIGAALKLCELFGWAYFANGLWVMQEAAEGNHHPSNGSGWARLVFGACAAKLPLIVKATQGSMGVSLFS